MLEIDRERRRIRLGMRQLEPTTVDHYISEHQPGETVSGRLLEVRGDRAKVELGEGVIGNLPVEAGRKRKGAAEPAESGGRVISERDAGGKMETGRRRRSRQRRRARRAGAEFPDRQPGSR